jgi:hypothetical protein
MAFDYQSKRMLLYGGEGAYLDRLQMFDAWSWDGIDWRLLGDNGQPELQTGSAMASAPNLGVFLINPGSALTTINGNREPLLATYRWNTASWTTASSAGPTSRIWPGFSYDPGLGSLLLFGGVFPGPGAGCEWGPDDMWAWDAQSWTQVNPAGLRPCGGVGSLTYDTAHKAMIWFGVDGTWAWDGKQWTQLATTAQSPPWSSWGTLTYDPTHRQVLLTGMLNGDGTSSPTYVWDGTLWTAP